jgi:hypothetical protein
MTWTIPAKRIVITAAAIGTGVSSSTSTQRAPMMRSSLVTRLKS